MLAQKYQRGVIDLLSLAGLVFLVVTLVVTTKVVSDPKIKQLIGARARYSPDALIRQRERQGGCEGADCLIPEILENKENQTGEGAEIVEKVEKALQGDEEALSQIQNDDVVRQIQEQQSTQTDLSTQQSSDSFSQCLSTGKTSSECGSLLSGGEIETATQSVGNLAQDLYREALDGNQLALEQLRNINEDYAAQAEAAIVQQVENERLEALRQKDAIEAQNVAITATNEEDRLQALEELRSLVIEGVITPQKFQDIYIQVNAPTLPTAQQSIAGKRSNGARCSFNSECVSEYCTSTCTDKPFSSALPFRTDSETTLEMCRSSAEAQGLDFTYFNGICNIESPEADRLRQLALQSEFIYNLSHPDLPDPVYNFAYCSREGLTPEQTQSCNQNMNTIYNLPLVGDYIKAYKPSEVKIAWKEAGYETLENCQDDLLHRFGARAASSCNTYQVTKEQATSSIKLGTAVTAAIFLPGAIVEGITGGTLVATTFTTAATYSTLFQTSNAAVAQIEDPLSSEANWQTALAALSWLNLGTAQALSQGPITNILGNPVSTKVLNTGVSVLNFAVDAPTAFNECRKEGASLSLFSGCGGGILATVLDVGFGRLDYTQGQLGFKNPWEFTPPSSRSLPGYTTINLDNLYHQVMQDRSNIYNQVIPNNVTPLSASAQLPNTGFPSTGRIYTQTEMNLLLPRVTDGDMLFAPAINSNTSPDLPRIYTPLDVELAKSLQLYNLTDQWAKVAIDKLNELKSFNPIALRQSNSINPQTNISNPEQLRAIEEVGWDVLDAIAPPQIANTLDQADDLGREISPSLNSPRTLDQRIGDTIFGRVVIENVETALPSDIFEGFARFIVTPSPLEGTRVLNLTGVPQIFADQISRFRPGLLDNLQRWYTRNIQDEIGLLPWLRNNNLDVGRLPEIPTSPNLAAQRPPELTESINEEFSSFASTPTGLGYIFTGRSPDYRYGPLSATDVVRRYVNSNINGSPIRVLDVGTAGGGFLKNLQNEFGQRVDLYGLSAQDFRKPDDPLAGIDYKIGDAENLRTLYPENEFDVITSSVTITHFKDPLSAVQEMYRSLKKGGVLMIDKFELPGLEGQIDNLIQFLRREGYEITSKSGRSIDFIPGQLIDTHVDYLVIRKTTEALELPVRYSGIDPEGGAIYSLTSEIPAVDIRLPAKVTNILNMPPVKYSGDPKAQFDDLIRSEDTWKSVYKLRKEGQLQLAIDTGASQAEIAVLRKLHSQIEEAVEEYFQYLRPRNIQLENEAVSIALGQQTSLLTRISQSTSSISQRIRNFWEQRVVGSWERLRGFLSNPASERGSLIIPPLSEPPKNTFQNAAGLPETQSFIPPHSAAEVIDYYGSEPQRVGTIAPWKDPENSLTVYHGSPEAISVRADFDGVTNSDGSLTLGTGLYTTLDESVARNYAELRSSSGSTGFVNELKVYDANILDLRERPNDLNSPNKPLSNKIAQDWLAYVESIKPIRTQPGHGGKFLDEIFERMWSEYYDYLKIKVDSGNSLNLRELLGTDPPLWGGSPDWSDDFREFMLSRKIDGVIYIEGGEGVLSQSNDATFILYNYEKIGTLEDWTRRIEPTVGTTGTGLPSERGAISAFYFTPLGVIPAADYIK